MTDDYGMTKLDTKFFKKAVIVLLCIAIIAVAVVVYRNNRWKGTINVKYIGYTSSDNGYHEWELKNESGTTLNGVKIVYKVDNWQEFTFEHKVGTLHVGETKTVRLYWNTVKAEAEKRNKMLMLANVDILRIVYD